ncbi:hypothetical protein GCM10027589_58760 [Actinocorallia lasiicapitis]
MDLVPEGFVVPEPPVFDGFRLEPLGAEHNERDHAAWTSSIAHVRATAGFDRWPPLDGMSLEANLADLEKHARDFAERRGFTYSVLDGDDVIGCVYLYPSRTEPGVATLKSWVRADRAALDGPLHDAVRTWITGAWPLALAPR